MNFCFEACPVVGLADLLDSCQLILADAGLLSWFLGNVIFEMVVCFASCLVAWLVCRLAGWLVGLWLATQLGGLKACRVVCRLLVGSGGRLISSLVCLNPPMPDARRLQSLFAHRRNAGVYHTLAKWARRFTPLPSIWTKKIAFCNVLKRVVRQEGLNHCFCTVVYGIL